MDIFTQFATDDKKENEGVWKDIGGGGRLLVARAGNKKYHRMLAHEVETNQQALDVKTEAADELSDRIMVNVLAETILLGFEGIEFKGQPLTYSKENARTVLAIKDFRALVSRISNDLANYRATVEAAVTKN